MNDLLNYGVLGIVVVCMAAYIIRIESRHKEEKEQMEEQHRDERNEYRRSNERLTEETNRNIRENTGVLNGLKALLESKR